VPLPTPLTPVTTPPSVTPDAGAHGDDARRVAAALGIDPAALLDLAATLNPVAPDLTEVVAAAATSIRWYPDATRATAALAEHLGVATERVVLTNGGAEAIALVAAAFPAGSVDQPEFGLYEQHLTSLDDPSRRWASNPNNPTGRLAVPSARAFVWDEAHYVLATGQWSRRDEHAIVIGSLTKAFACPGLRIGYLVAPDPPTAEQLRRRQPAWSLNSIAAEVVPSLLDRVDVATWPAQIGELRADLERVLRAHDFEPLPSDAPWVLVPNSRGLRRALIDHHVLVRDCTSFGLPGFTRIAVPDAEGLGRLSQALARIG